jgi:hypothetical protein
MAYEVPGEIIGNLNATADLSALQFSFVSLTTLGGVTGTTIITSRPLGILQNAPTSNQVCEIMVGGISKLVAATTAIVPGDLLASTAAGRGVTVAAGTTCWVGAALTSGVMTVKVFDAFQLAG